MENFLNNDFIDPSAFSRNDIPGIIRNIINLMLILAPVVGVIYLIFAGFKFITAGGDADKAREARNAVLQVIIGIIIVFSTYAVISFVLEKVLGV